MDNSEEFKKLLKQIMKKDPEPTLSPEEITFEVEVMQAIDAMAK